jgi:hypothetical protein
MKRVTLSVLASISTLLVVGCIAIWVRSYRPHPSTVAHDIINFTHVAPLYWIISYPGEAVLCRQVGKNWDVHELLTSPSSACASAARAAPTAACGLCDTAARSGVEAKLWHL